MAISQKAIEKAIIEHKGNVTKVAQSFGVTRGAIQKRVAKSGTLKRILQESRDMRNDSVRDALYEEGVDKRNVTALIFIAKTQMGWTEKQEVKHTGNVSITDELLANKIARTREQLSGD